MPSRDLLRPLSSRTRVQGALLVSLVRVPEDHEWRQLRTEILDAVARWSPRGVVLDLDQADVFDDFDLRAVLATRDMVRLMGLPLVLSGLRSEVVRAWACLGMLPHELDGYDCVQAALDGIGGGSACTPTR